jgi:hypothetical protein
MSLNYLDTSKIQQYLTTMWQKNLSTSEDPANGQWYTNGANGDGIGLYGGLSDSIESQVQFDESSKSSTAALAVVVDTATVDNTNGLSPNSTATLTYQHSVSTQTSHTTTNSITATAGASIKGNATILGTGVEATVSFSFSYTHSWQDTTSTTTTDTTTFSQSVPMTVPTGKIYMAELTADAQQLTVPYTAAILVSGTTETWFADRINGHYNWNMNAASAFQNIGSSGAAGADSQYYTSMNGQGAVIQNGTMVVSQSVNFKVKIYDITPSPTNSAARSAQTASANKVLVMEIPVTSH